MAPPAHERAAAKLTRSLRVVGRREDGYHLIESEMVSLDLADELEIEPGGDQLRVRDEIAWCGAGPTVDLDLGAIRENSVCRALSVLRTRAAVLLTKHIPPAAGLAGGSADAAAILRWAKCEDHAVAASIGADVAFCVHGGRAMVTGIGEVVRPLEFEATSFVLVTPSLAVSTPAVYAAFDALGAAPGGSNDLERAALAVEPRLEQWRGLLAEVTGVRPSLAGSGSTWFVEAPLGTAHRLADDLRDAVSELESRALVAVASATPPY